MAQGLVIKNADGSVKLDTNSNITRTIGQATLQGSGEITSAGIGYPAMIKGLLLTINLPAWKSLIVSRCHNARNKICLATRRHGTIIGIYSRPGIRSQIMRWLG